MSRKLTTRPHWIEAKDLIVSADENTAEIPMQSLHCSGKIDHRLSSSKALASFTELPKSTRQSRVVTTVDLIGAVIE
jgi:hypothetical protein